MNCAYHVRNPATAHCNSCGKGLCRGCDHRVKGYPFCENCILAGVESLRNTSRAKPTRRMPMPALSFLLSWLCPGLGSAYNGETVSAFVHFGLVAGLFQLAVQTDGMPMPVLGFIALWFAILPIDAYLSAKRIRIGISSGEDGVDPRLVGGRRFLALILAVIGVVIMLTLILGPTFVSNGILPVLLIALGFHASRNFIKSRRMLSSVGNGAAQTDQERAKAARGGSWK